VLVGVCRMFIDRVKTAYFPMFLRITGDKSVDLCIKDSGILAINWPKSWNNVPKYGFFKRHGLL